VGPRDRPHLTPQRPPPPTAVTHLKSEEPLCPRRRLGAAGPGLPARWGRHRPGRDGGERSGSGSCAGPGARFGLRCACGDSGLRPAGGERLGRVALDSSLTDSGLRLPGPLCLAGYRRGGRCCHPPGRRLLTPRVRVKRLLLAISTREDSIDKLGSRGYPAASRVKARRPQAVVVADPVRLATCTSLAANAASRKNSFGPCSLFMPGAGYRPGSDRGSPNHGSTLASKRVMAQIRSPARVST
jgi:hypothetical protein